MMLSALRAHSGGDHQTVRLVKDGHAFALRLPHRRPEPLMMQARLAGAWLGDQSGMGPRFRASDYDSGVMIVDWIDGQPAYAPLPLTKFALASRLGEALRHVHATPAPPQLPVADLVAIAQSLNLAAIFMEIAQALAATQTELCASHGDLVPDNMIVAATGEIRLIDWDYAALHDPCWDLAYAIQELGLNNAESDALFAAYGRTMPAQRIILFRTLIIAINAAWRQANRQPVSDHALQLAQILSTHEVVRNALAAMVQQAHLTGR